MSIDSNRPDHETGLDRRQLIKKTVAGAAAAGVVWSAPKIEGLTLRPDYAAAASGTTTALGFFEFLVPPAIPFPNNTAFANANLGGGALVAQADKMGSLATTITIRPIANTAGANYNGAGTVRVTSVANFGTANVVSATYDPASNAPDVLNGSLAIALNSATAPHGVRVTFICT